MSELWLIAHKVRGEPAFDVAVRMECPICNGEPENDPDESGGCVECDSTGCWWIIPTSGHRAYPWRWWKLDHLRYQSQAEVQEWDDVIQPMDEIQNGIPNNWPDHYPTSASPNKPKLNLAELLPKAPPIRRRV